MLIHSILCSTSHTYEKEVILLQIIKKNLIFILIILSILVFLFYDKAFSTEDSKEQSSEEIVNSKPVELTTEESSKNEESKKFVDVKGEVVKPGVYEFNGVVRVSDIIELAGGFTEDADTKAVNLAQKVFDEMVIIVATQGEGLVIQETIEQSKNDQDNKVRINYATSGEIASLKGIGEVKAEAIVQHREQHGYYQSVDDLLDVTGIGEKTLESIKEAIVVP